MEIGAALAVLGGIIALVGIENPRRKVLAADCPGGALAGASQDTAASAVPVAGLASAGSRNSDGKAQGQERVAGHRHASRGDQLRPADRAGGQAHDVVGAELDRRAGLGRRARRDLQARRALICRASGRDAVSARAPHAQLQRCLEVAARDRGQTARAGRPGSPASRPRA